MNFLGRAFSEPGGKASSHRLLVAFACVTILGTWAGVSIQKKELQTMDTNEAAIVIGALGVGAWKRGKEGPGASNEQPTTK